jgi:hypothetical protein
LNSADGLRITKFLSLALLSRTRPYRVGC